MTLAGARLDWIVAVDWGKDFKKRRAWVADVRLREVRALEVGSGRLGEVFEVARRLGGRVLVGIDAVLGVPRSYFEHAVNEVPAWRDVADFLTWVRRAVATPGFLDEVHSADAWTPGRPFIAVPKGAGSLNGFWKKTGGRLLRWVDRKTHANSAFIVSGIPGTVGSGTRALWQELARLLPEDRDFALWPFEGSLATLTLQSRVVLAEIYPRVCYALALDAALPAPLRRLAKTKREARVDAIAKLVGVPWFREYGITLTRSDDAAENEDDFDAMISAAGLLRCVLGGHALEPSTSDACDPVEGGILGVAALDLSDPR